MPFATMTFPVILFGLAQLLKLARRRYPAFAARLKERNLVAQIKAKGCVPMRPPRASLSASRGCHVRAERPHDVAVLEVGLAAV